MNIIELNHGETSVHAMLESLKHLGLNYLQKVTTPSSNLSNITLEIHWTTITEQETMNQDFNQNNIIRTTRKQESNSTTVWWVKGTSLYAELVKEVPEDEWTKLSYGEITYQRRVFQEDEEKGLYEYIETTPVDHVNLRLLQQSIETNPIPCTLKLEVKTKRKYNKLPLFPSWSA